MKTVRILMVMYCLTIFAASIWVPWKGASFDYQYPVAAYYSWVMNADPVYVSGFKVEKGRHMHAVSVDWSRLLAEYVAITALYGAVYFMIGKKSN